MVSGARWEFGHWVLSELHGVPQARSEELTEACLNGGVEEEGQWGESEDFYQN